jgi:hypothetical protein
MHFSQFYACNSIFLDPIKKNQTQNKWFMYKSHKTLFLLPQKGRWIGREEMGKLSVDGKSAILLHQEF